VVVVVVVKVAVVSYYNSTQKWIAKNKIEEKYLYSK